MEDNNEQEKNLDEKQDAIVKEAYKAMMKLSVPEWISWFIAHLGNLTWQYIGLIENPVTKTVEKDFDQASLAIDTISALVELVQDKLPEENKKELQGLISNLKVNFVNQKNKG